MVQLADLERIAPGVVNLSPEEYEALQRFTLLWTIFEAQVLESNASVRKITDVITALDPQVIDGGWFQEHVRYFSNRYVENAETNHRFDDLFLRKNDNPELVSSVLKGENIEPKFQLIVCLIIVYRFRNNFFHGRKWAYGLQDQYENFTHSACLLSECMVRFKHTI